MQRAERSSLTEHEQLAIRQFKNRSLEQLWGSRLLLLWTSAFWGCPQTSSLIVLMNLVACTEHVFTEPLGPDSWSASVAPWGQSCVCASLYRGQDRGPHNTFWACHNYGQSTVWDNRQRTKWYVDHCVQGHFSSSSTVSKKQTECWLLPGMKAAEHVLLLPNVNRQLEMKMSRGSFPSHFGKITADCIACSVNNKQHTPYCYCCFRPQGMCWKLEMLIRVLCHCVRACVRACVCERVRACVRACVCVCVCVVFSLQSATPWQHK